MNMTEWRRKAVAVGDGAYKDAEAVKEMNINADDVTVRQYIENAYKYQLPDSKLGNSHCTPSQLLSGVNNPWQRVMRWKNEDYYIVGVSTTYKFMTILNLILIIATVLLSFYVWQKKCEIKLVSKEGADTKPEEIQKLQKIHKMVGTYMSVSISILLFIYGASRVFKRTTRACHAKTSPSVSDY